MSRIHFEHVQGSEARSIAEAAAIAFSVEKTRNEGLDYDEVLVAARRQSGFELETAGLAPLSGIFLIRGPDNACYGEIWLAARDTPVEDCRHILWLTIWSEHRRRGFASATIERLIADASSAGVAALTLNVFDTNKAAAELYRQHGFRRYDRGLILWLASPLLELSRRS